MFVRPSALFAALALAATTPAAAQINIGVHIDIPILGNGRGPVVVHRPAPPPRYITVYDYSPGRYGRWDKEYRKWKRVTMYVYDGRYYERPFYGARPVVLYYYRNQYFFEPRDRDFYRYRGDRDWDRDPWDRDRDREWQQERAREREWERDRSRDRDQQRNVGRDRDDARRREEQRVQENRRDEERRAAERRQQDDRRQQEQRRPPQDDRGRRRNN